MNYFLAIISSLLIPNIIGAATAPSGDKKYVNKNYKKGQLYEVDWTLNTTKFMSNDACVTVQDLIAFHYTDGLNDMDVSSNVSPDNFCYGILQYNITREDFFNIIEKNRNAFKNYRTLIPLYIVYNLTQFAIMDDGCAGYLRIMSCYNEFPACIDEGGNKFRVEPICNKICNKYKIRCSDVSLYILIL